MREKLPTRRDARTITISYDNSNWHVSYSLYPDGRIAEVFFRGAKAGSHLANTAYAAGVALSIAFQNGASLEEIASACPRNEDETPADLIGAVCDALWQQLDEQDD